MTILARFDVVQHVAGDEFAAGVVAVGIVGLEHAQAVFDGEAGRDDEKAAGEVLAAGAADGVDRLPGDQHRHDGGLAGAGGQLQGETQQFGVGVVVGGGQVFEESLAVLRLGATSVSQMAVSTASTWQKNGRTPVKLWWRQCWSRRAVSGVTCHSLGLGHARQVHVAAHFVDDRGGVVLLLLGRKPLALIEDEILLAARFLAFLRLGDWRDELGPAAVLDDLLGRLAVLDRVPNAARDTRKANSGSDVRRKGWPSSDPVLTFGRSSRRIPLLADRPERVARAVPVAVPALSARSSSVGHVIGPASFFRLRNLIPNDRKIAALLAAADDHVEDGIIDPDREDHPASGKP